MNRMIVVLGAAFCVAVMAAGCSSSKEEGVTSSYRSQWTMVGADTRTTTEAARAVLEEQGLKEIKADSTMVDGTAEGRKADGTEIKVSIKKKGEGASEITTTVGALGSPTLGAEITRKIADRAQKAADARPAGAR
jgi:hypothetical protein